MQKIKKEEFKKDYRTLNRSRVMKKYNLNVVAFYEIARELKLGRKPYISSKKYKIVQSSTLILIIKAMKTKKKVTETRVAKQYSPVKIRDMITMSSLLKNHIVKQNLYTEIRDKNYAHVEGWQYAGGLMGLLAIVKRVENLSSEKEFKWKSDVEIIELKSGKILSNGFALCSNKENKKKDFDEYAVLSMSQTRAIGKAYRNLIGWVMKLAGYEGTPSEEMRGLGETPKEPVITYGKAENTKNFDPLVCHGFSKAGCGNNITKQESEFSKKIYGKPLCRSCQKLSKPKKKK